MAKQQTDTKKDHSKHYYEQGRNGWTPTTTWQDEVIEDKDDKWSGGKINPKMLMSKEELGLWDDNIPEYYKGANGYEARKVCDNFDLTYHLATAVTYILRAYRKHEEPISDLKKAIAHLQFELEKIERDGGQE